MSEPRDSKATRRAIIEAAGRLFAQRGFSGVTARQVASEAGVALSAIPYHFGSMDGLYREALVIACQVSPEAIPLAARAIAEAPDVGLRTAVRWAIVDASAAGTSWPTRLLFREDLDPSPAFKEVLRTKIVPEWNWLRRVIARASGRAPDSPEVKFGVIAMYNVTAALHIRTGMIDHLAADVVESMARAREASIECISRLTLDAVATYAATVGVEKNARRTAPAAKRSAGAKPAARGGRAGAAAKGGKA